MTRKIREAAALSVLLCQRCCKSEQKDSVIADYKRCKGREQLMTHSKKLEETALWKIYQEKAGSDGNRCEWVKEVYEDAAE